MLQPLHPDRGQRSDTSLQAHYARPEFDGPEQGYDAHYMVQPFSEAEDRDLLRALEDGACVAEIAMDLGRRQSDVDRRIRHLLRHQPLRQALTEVRVGARVPTRAAVGVAVPLNPELSTLPPASPGGEA